MSRRPSVAVSLFLLYYETIGRNDRAVSCARKQPRIEQTSPKNIKCIRERAVYDDKYKGPSSKIFLVVPFLVVAPSSYRSPGGYRFEIGRLFE